ncbi:MAG TPA: hypothetical protein VKC55_01505 [Actinomycetota bacterium]|nr:hypothetical protein [Actinomycetota bacterium]
MSSEEMNIEAAYGLSERGVEEKQRKRPREVAEIVEVIILAIVAVATAWSGYQAARWDGRQAFLYGESTRLRVEASEAATLGGQQRLQDISTFNTWIVAYSEGKDEIAHLYVERFSPEYKVAFDAWLATMPFSNPDAPPGPSYMPEYHNAQTEHAAKLNKEASAAFDGGTEARDNAERYVRQTVLFATVLFLIAISQRFTYRAVRLTATGIAGAVLLFALIGEVTLPRL